MRSVILFSVIGTAWIGVGPFLAWFMGRRGYDRLSWLAVGLISGPSALVMATMERMSGIRTEPEVVVRGSVGSGRTHVLLSLDHGEDAATAAQPFLEKFDGFLGQVSIVRVLPEGGPGADQERARTALKREAARLARHGADATLRLGDVAEEISAKATDEGYQVVVTQHRDEELAAKLAASGVRYLGGRSEAKRMVTRGCLALPETRHDPSRGSFRALEPSRPAAASRRSAARFARTTSNGDVLEPVDARSRVDRIGEYVRVGRGR